jgi:hypothetical protein
MPEWGCIYEGQAWDEDLCECHCPNEETTICEKPSFFSPKQGCQCVFPCDVKPPTYGCPLLTQHWCQETCTCECLEDLNRTCNSLQHWDNNECYCKCNECIECTNPKKEFNPYTCQCECTDITGCDEDCYAKNPLWIYNPDECGCECPNQAEARAKCIANTLFKYDFNKCECSCKRVQTCTGGRRFNPATCTCV